MTPNFMMSTIFSTFSICASMPAAFYGGFGVGEQQLALGAAGAEDLDFLHGGAFCLLECWNDA
jgi:hypothetical protein